MSTTKKHLIWLPTGGHIGDAVMILSLFAEIIECNPDIHIDYLVRRNAEAIAGLARPYPAVTIRSIPFSSLGALRVLLPLFKYRAVVIAPPPWSARPRILKILSFLFKLRGDYVIAFEDDRFSDGKWHPYNVTIKHDLNKRYIDNLRRATLLSGLLTKEIGSSPHLEITTSLPDGFPFVISSYIAVHLFPHMSMAKSLPLRRWKTILSKLATAHPEYRLVITGIEADRAQAEELQKAVPKIYLAIGLSLPELAGVIAHAKLYLGVDTGPTHIAGVLHAPSVVIAQQKEPMWLPTYNPNATLIWEKKNCTCGTSTPCGAEEDGVRYRRCVYDLSDEAILNAIEKRLKI